MRKKICYDDVNKKILNINNRKTSLLLLYSAFYISAAPKRDRIRS